MSSRLAKQAAAIALLGAMAFAFGCAQPAPPAANRSAVVESLPTSAPPASSLGGVEVRGFKGKPLDEVATEPETSLNGPPQLKIEEYRLEVTGTVKSPLRLTYDQVLALPPYRKVTTLHCVDGWSKTYLWQGVLLKDLLQSAGYDPDAKLVIFRCADGYSESLPLDFIVSKNIILGYGINGRALPAERGFPFQVVAEDKYGYKWAKWITSIEVSNDLTFRGHYEKMGADNTATVPGAE